jgi:hypothetical protein
MAGHAWYSDGQMSKGAGSAPADDDTTDDEEEDDDGDE